MVYAWKIPKFSIPAQIAGREMERISSLHGSLTPSVVVEESKSKKAVLHPCFEWDDQQAAECYRKVQAQELIRNIVTVGVSGTQLSAPVRAFVNIEKDYKPIDIVIHNKDYSDEMFAKALQELKNFKVKYAALEQLAEILTSIDSVIYASWPATQNSESCTAKQKERHSPGCNR